MSARARVQASSEGGQPAALLDGLCRSPAAGFPVLEGVALRLLPMHALPAHAAALRPLLDEGELARAAAIRHPQRSLAYLGGRAVARLMLSSFVDATVAPSAWKIVPDGAGKPRLACGAGISIAHTDDLLGVAVTAGGEVGLDVERLAQGCAVPPEHLHPAEIALLRSLPAWRGGDAGLRLWTVKEAVAKCRGDGVAADFPAIDASPALTESSFLAGGCAVVARAVEVESRFYGVALARAVRSRR